MTNIIAFLHTTSAYQAAALQLMIGEANFAAEQLGIPERLPVQTNRLVIAEVGPPALGVNGAVGTSNYTFGFDHGHLTSVRKRDWMKRLDPPITNVSELSKLSSRIDTNGAYQLATQWLNGLSFMVSALNERFVPQIVQVPGGGAAAKTVALPMFQVTWGEKPPPFDMVNPLRMRLLGSTLELLELHVRDHKLCGRPPLVVSNQAKLLEPWPTPRDYVEGLFGGPEGYRAVTAPETVDLYVLNSRFREDELSLPEVRLGPVRMNGSSRQQLADILVDFDTYQWGVMKLCSVDYGVKARFIRGRSIVQVLFCFECDILEVTVDGKARNENFDFNHNALVRIIRQVFPADRRIRRLEENPDEEQGRENFIRSLREQAD